MITITFDKKEALAVLKEAEYIAKEFGCVTLADIYDLAGLTHTKDDANIKYRADDVAKMFDIILETEPKKMTIAEIERELGYSVAIVKEEDK